MPKKPEEEKKVKRSYSITRSTDARVHRLAVRMNSSLNGVIDQAVAMLEEVLDYGVEGAAQRHPHPAPAPDAEEGAP